MSLAPGWARATLGEIGRWQGGGTPSKSEDHLWRQGTIPWVSPKDMKSNIIADTKDKLSEVARSHPSFKLVPVGAVLVVTRSGILKHTLPVAVTATAAAINQDIKALIPYPGINARFIALQLRADSARILAACVKAGTTVESIDFTRLRDFPIKVPPLNEQARIADRLEPLLARCDLIRAELARVGQLIARLRHSVLDAAFRGSLNQASKFDGSLPANWKVVPLSSLIIDRPSNGFSPPATSSATGTLSLRLTATTSGKLRLDEGAVKWVDARLPPDSKYWLKPGDLLVQRANALEHVGASAIFEGEERKYIYPDLMMRVRIEDSHLRRYIWRYLNSPTARQYFRSRASGVAGNMPKITGKILSDLPIPLAPPDKINSILNGIDRFYARLDAIESENIRCLRLVEKLEKTLLNRALEGRLVKQDPSDEPAAASLERVKSGNLKSKDKIMTTSHSQAAPQTEDVRTYIERKFDVWPTDGVTFEKLRAEAPGSYEELKGLVFELIEMKKLGQKYDSRERKMKLVRLA